MTIGTSAIIVQCCSASWKRTIAVRRTASAGTLKNARKRSRSSRHAPRTRSTTPIASSGERRGRVPDELADEDARKAFEEAVAARRADLDEVVDPIFAGRRNDGARALDEVQADRRPAVRLVPPQHGRRHEERDEAASVKRRAAQPSARRRREREIQQRRRHEQERGIFREERESEERTREKRPVRFVVFAHPFDREQVGDPQRRERRLRVQHEARDEENRQRRDHDDREKTPRAALRSARRGGERGGRTAPLRESARRVRSPALRRRSSSGAPSTPRAADDRSSSSRESATT